MKRRHEPCDEQWLRIELHLPERRTGENNQVSANAVPWGMAEASTLLVNLVRWAANIKGVAASCLGVR